MRRKARRRLIGAIVLVAALVILLPMVLDHEPKPIGADVPIRIPEPPAVATESAPASIENAVSVPAPTSRAEAAPTDTSTPAPTLVAKSDEQDEKVEANGSAHSSAKAPAEPAAKKRSESNAAPNVSAGATAAAASSAGGAFVVQVGAFSNAAKAAQAQKKVAAAGLPVFTETIDVSGQSRIRVRAGPFEQRAQAEAALEKLSEIGFGGKLMMK